MATDSISLLIEVFAIVKLELLQLENLLVSTRYTGEFFESEDFDFSVL